MDAAQFVQAVRAMLETPGAAVRRVAVRLGPSLPQPWDASLRASAMPSRNHPSRSRLLPAGPLRRIADVDGLLCARVVATNRQGDGLYPPGLRWLRPRYAGLPCDARSHGPVAKLALLTSFAPLGQRRRVRGRGAPASRRAGHAPCASRRRRFAPAGTARRLALAPVDFAAQVTVVALAAGGTRQGRSVGRREAQRSGGSPARSAGPARRIYAAARQRRRGATAAAPRSEHRRAVPRSGTAPV